MPKLVNHDSNVAAVRKAISEFSGDFAPWIEVRCELDYPTIEHSAQHLFLLTRLKSQYADNLPFDALICASDQDAAHAVRWLQSSRRLFQRTSR